MERERILTAKEIWDQKNLEVVSLRSRILEDVSELLDKGIITAKYGPEEFVLGSIVLALQKHFEDVDLRKYAVYNAYIGSSPDYDLSPESDLEGNQIMKDIKEIHEKIRKASETGKLEL